MSKEPVRVATKPFFAVLPNGRFNVCDPREEWAYAVAEVPGFERWQLQTKPDGSDDLYDKHWSQAIPAAIERDLRGLVHKSRMAEG